MKRFGFFGGTFDPIHFGHLHLALAISEKWNLDQVFFSPASFSLGKRDMPVASPFHRKEMVGLAIDPIPSFVLFDAELTREGPSYTIDTLRKLSIEHADALFYLILGEDLLAQFQNWKEVEELIKLAPPLIGTRAGNRGDVSAMPSFLIEPVAKGKVEIPLMDISSTYLRERLSSKKYCGHLIPSKVLDYIEVNQIY